VVFQASTVSIDLRPQKSAKFRNRNFADENPALQLLFEILTLFLFQEIWIAILEDSEERILKSR
jgi:hypothetical protein